MSGSAPREDNRIPGLVAKSDADNTPVIIEADPITKRLKVNATITGGGTSGTQYTDGGATTAHPTGTIPVFDDAGTITAVSDTNPLPVLASISTAGLATDSNQTDGSQKTQIVDSGGEAATVTGGKLDVNASIDTTGLATSAKQDTGNTSLTSIDGKITAVNTGAVVVSSSALPSGASTLAKQPALGTAGTASSDVITIQGITSMTPILATVTGTVTANAGTNLNTSALALAATQTDKSQFTKLTDGTDTALITASGEQNVLESNSTAISASLSVMDDWDDGADSAKIVGNVAAAATDSGSPVKVGAVNMTTLPTYTDGQRTNLQAGTRGSLLFTPMVPNSTTAYRNIADNADGVVVSATANFAGTLSRNTVFNGTSWDRLPGDTTGISIKDGGNSITVDQSTASNLNMTEASAASILTSVQLIDDVIYTDDTSTHSTGNSKGALFMAAATPTDGSVNANDIGAVAMTTDRKLHVSVQDALPAGANAIGKLAANSGVDIGDVDVTSIAAGTNRIGDVDIAPRTTGGWSVANFTSGDTYTALTNTAQVIKASAGKFGGYYIYNPNVAATYVQVYDVAAASVTVGTTTAKLVFCIPAGSAANLELIAGIPFANAGWSAAATTTGGGNSAPSTALEAMVFYL